MPIINDFGSWKIHKKVFKIFVNKYEFYYVYVLLILGNSYIHVLSFIYGMKRICEKIISIIKIFKRKYKNKQTICSPIISEDLYIFLFKQKSLWAINVFLFHNREIFLLYIF